MSNIRIDIASEFKDKGFKQAEKATGGLQGNLKALGKTLIGVLSVREIYQFGKAAVKAFGEDELAAKRLTQSLSNLGLAFEDARVAKFISDLEATSGVLDDSLRPAFQSLLTTTGSVTKAQELLGLALDVAAGSGQDVQTVASDLSKAYTGNTRSLAKYNTGLSRAELQTASFADVQALLAKQFTGQNAAYLDTYAGKVAILNVAYANMQETIGKGLVDAFQILSGDRGIAGGTSAMQDFGDKVADTERGIATLIAGFKDLQSYVGLVREFAGALIGSGNVLQAIQQVGKVKPQPFKTPMTVSGSTDAQTKIDRARAKAEADAAKRAKELLELTKKQTKSAAAAAKKQQELQKLAKAKAVFDLEKIQIEAALQGKITEEERIRLQLMKAIADENVGKTEELLKKLKEIQDENAKLAKQLTEFPEANDPFAQWGQTLTGVMTQLTAIAQKKIVVDFLANFTPSTTTIIPTTPSTSAAAVAAVTSPAAQAASSAASAAASEAAGDAYAEIAKAQAAAAAAAEAAAAAAAAIAAAKSQAEKIAAEEAARAAAAAAAAAAVQEEAAAALLAAAAAQEAANAAAEAAQAQQVAELLASDGAAQAAANALTEASFIFEESVMGAFGAGVPINNIYVTVEGSVTAVQDLAEVITDIQYEYQRNGKGLRFSSIAI